MNAKTKVLSAIVFIVFMSVIIIGGVYFKWNWDWCVFFADIASFFASLSVITVQCYWKIHNHIKNPIQEHINFAILIRSTSNIIALLNALYFQNNHHICFISEMVRNITGLASFLFIFYILIDVGSKILKINCCTCSTRQTIDKKTTKYTLYLKILCLWIVSIVNGFCSEWFNPGGCWVNEGNIDSTFLIIVTFYIYLILLYVWLLFMFIVWLINHFYIQNNNHIVIHALSGKLVKFYIVMLFSIWMYPTIRRICNAMNTTFLPFDEEAHHFLTGLYGVGNAIVYFIYSYYVRVSMERKNKSEQPETPICDSNGDNEHTCIYRKKQNEQSETTYETKEFTNNSSGQKSGTAHQSPTNDDVSQIYSHLNSAAYALEMKTISKRGGKHTPKSKKSIVQIFKSK
eukprot:139184_1